MMHIKKVACAISGGIDSAVTAALLKEVGNFEVIGLFMDLWTEGKLKNRSLEAEKRARKIAKFLNIPFHKIDLKSEFKKRIVNCFIKDYKKGLTPNPCIVCNKEIKFGLLLQKAKKLGADFMATGHYARIRFEEGKVELLKGTDSEKDQSYFLWKLNQNQLKRILFPLGGYKKSEVKKMAGSFKLPVSESFESQEICFADKHANSFLRESLKVKPGKIKDTMGRTLGQHIGLWFYTIGQRKRIKLPQGPFYVLDKDFNKNVLIVTKKESELFKKTAFLKEINWISDKEPELPIKAKVKIRYKSKPVSALIEKLKDNNCIIQFQKSQRAVTPGQSAVFYEKDKVLGGGIIF